MKKFKRIYQKIENFFVKLQNSDELTKKRWLIFFVSFLMILILFVWLKYFQITLPKLEKPLEQEDLLFKGDGSSSFWETMRNGFKTIFEELRIFLDEFKKLNQKVHVPEEIIVK